MSVEYMFDFVIIRQSPHFSDDKLEKNSHLMFGVEIRLGQLVIGVSEPFPTLCPSHFLCDALFYQKKALATSCCDKTLTHVVKVKLGKVKFSYYICFLSYKITCAVEWLSHM